MKPLNAPRAPRQAPGRFRPLAAIAVLTTATITGCASVDGGRERDSSAQAPAASQAAATARAAAQMPPVSQAGGAAGPHVRQVAQPSSAEDPADLPKVDLTPQIIFQLLASEIAAQRGQACSATVTYLSLAQKAAHSKRRTCARSCSSRS